MSKKLTLKDDNTVTVEDATLLDPIMNAMNSSITFTGVAKYTLPVASAVGAAVFVNKRHSGSFLNFGGRSQQF